MIFSRPLTSAESRTSLRRLALYNFANGLSFAGVGETVMVLVAVKLGCPDAVSATFGGTLFYAGFAAMPLGRLLAARWGAARAGGAFWALRNAFAMLVPAAAFWGAGRPGLVSATVLLGAAGFYACRSAGVVLYGPLVGEAAGPEERAGALGRLAALFNVGFALGYPAVLLVLRGGESIGRLAAIVAAGAALGVWSASFLFRAHETEVLREGARKPVLADLRALLAHRAYRRLVAGTAVVNLLYALVGPASVVVLKRGYGASDLEAMAYSGVLLVVGGACSWVNGAIARRIGPRMELVAANALLLAAAVAWTLLPDAAKPVSLAVAWTAVFCALGVAKALNETATLHYAVSAVEPRLVVSASLFLYLSTGLLAGVAGLALSALLMGRAADGGATAVPGPAALAAYRGYFRAVFWILLPLGAVVWRILPLRNSDPTRP
ncbi:MAG: MFS transporter [Kiritimatiellae bacterium]|nr:MFS transporter [Kiritimatiellia bacterium]